MVRLQGGLKELKICLMGTGLFAIRQIVSSDRAVTLMLNSDANALVDIIKGLQHNSVGVHMQESRA
ncbi:hypothetical protein HNP46_000235 [Pseudomonas nitritireducens]|uniref:Uncharacterized protein n=1 Tax=Pseudomonas nitroreducens TaxID=46680 RepID=A0A7W7NZB5_PSENT|nr:hypothetical protein [Pseudomonas nitritireducens]MBB4861424.1 hypothetical protein [Pseudomonas nitritireducens]